MESNPEPLRASAPARVLSPAAGDQRQCQLGAKRQCNLLPHHHAELMAPGREHKISSTIPLNEPKRKAHLWLPQYIDGPLWDRIWATWQSSALPPANDGQGRFLAISRSQPPPKAPISKHISVVETARAWTETDCKLRNSWPNVSDHFEVDPRFEM